MGILWVGLGGALGAMSRVLLSAAVPSSILGLPLPILCVNVLGCFALGLATEFMAMNWAASQAMRHLLVPGFLGGFTTFSAFALEFGLLYEKGETITAFGYAALSVLLSLGGFFLGMKLIR